MAIGDDGFEKGLRKGFAKVPGPLGTAIGGAYVLLAALENEGIVKATSAEIIAYVIATIWGDDNEPPGGGTGGANVVPLFPDAPKGTGDAFIGLAIIVVVALFRSVSGRRQAAR